MMMGFSRMVDEQTAQLKWLWRNKRSLLNQTLALAMIVLSALMMWRLLMIYTNSESPVVVILTGSMEPAIYRGDILLLDNSYETPIDIGEVVVFQIAEKEIPIVHRVVEVHRNEDGLERFLTKGDNNNVDDRMGGIYAPAQKWLSRDAILGRARIYVPQMGMLTILLNDNPRFKWLLLAVMGFFVLTTRE